MHRLVVNPARMHKFKYHEIPHDLYPALLTEAIFQRELQTITFLVSTWPHKILDIRSVLPREDIMRSGYLTRPIEGQGSMSLVDSIIMGLLNIKPHAKLHSVNFIGFKNGESGTKWYCTVFDIINACSNNFAAISNKIFSTFPQISLKFLQS